MLVNRTKREFEDTHWVSHSLGVSLCVSLLECGLTQNAAPLGTHSHAPHEPLRNTANRSRVALPLRCSTTCSFPSFGIRQCPVGRQRRISPTKNRLFRFFLVFVFFFENKCLFFGFCFSVWVRKLSKQCRAIFVLTLSSSADSQLFKNMLISKF